MIRPDFATEAEAPPNCNGNENDIAELGRCRITKSSLNPDGNAVTTKSTPGRTFAYVALAPDTLGVGNGDGHNKPTFPAPGGFTHTNGPDPPFDNRSGTPACAGTQPPAPSDTNVVSMSCHAPELSCTRVGPAVTVVVNEPSGFATTVFEPVRADNTSTGEPCRCAATIADAASARDATATVAVVDACARPGNTTNGNPAATSANNTRPVNGNKPRPTIRTGD